MNDRKKYERAEKVRQKLLRQKEQRTRERQEANREYHLTRLVRERPVPIRRGVGDPEADRIARDIEIRSKLERNMEILKALEEQIEWEQASRAETNDRLEAEGHETLKEKMEALQSQALEEQKADAGVGGTAEVVFTPNPEAE